MSIFSKPKPEKVAPTVSNYDEQWQRFSYGRWRTHYDSFLLEVDVESSGPHEINSIIQKAADAADEALRIEQERWGRTVLEGKS